MATLDLLTAAEALAAVNGRSADATELADYTTAASLAVDHWCGPVVQRTTTSELHDGGVSSIWLRYFPIISVTTVTEYGTAMTEETDATSPPTEGFLLVPYSSDPSLYGPQVIRRSDGSTTNWYTGERTVSVTYEAGRVANTASVDHRFKRACALVLQNMWRSQQTSTFQYDEYDVPAISFPRFGLPNAAKHLLAGEIQVNPEHQVVVA